VSTQIERKNVNRTKKFVVFYFVSIFYLFSNILPIFLILYQKFLFYSSHSEFWQTTLNFQFNVSSFYRSFYQSDTFNHHVMRNVIFLIIMCKSNIKGGKEEESEKKI
jgi:hypothetical protein